VYTDIAADVKNNEPKKEKIIIEEQVDPDEMYRRIQLIRKYQSSNHKLLRSNEISMSENGVSVSINNRRVSFNDPLFHEKLRDILCDLNLTI